MLLQKYGLSTLNSFAQNIGMTNTVFNRHFSCSGPHDTMTLDDAGVLFAGLAKHTILQAPFVKQLFGLMAGRVVDSAGTWGH